MIRSINTVATPTGHTIYLACDLQGVGHSLWHCSYDAGRESYGKWWQLNLPMATPKYTTFKDQKIESFQDLGDGKCQMSFVDAPNTEELPENDLHSELVRVACADVELQKSHPEYVEALKTGGFNERCAMVEENNDWIDQLKRGHELICVAVSDVSTFFKVGEIYRFSHLQDGVASFKCGVECSVYTLKKCFKPYSEEVSDWVDDLVVGDTLEYICPNNIINNIIFTQGHHYRIDGMSNHHFYFDDGNSILKSETSHDFKQVIKNEEAQKESENFNIEKLLKIIELQKQKIETLEEYQTLLLEKIAAPQEKGEDYFETPFHVLKPITKASLGALFLNIEKPSQKISLVTNTFWNSTMELVREIYNNNIELSGCIISRIETDTKTIHLTVNRVIKEEDDTDEFFEQQE